MKYKSIIVTKVGGPEVLQVMENDLREPSSGKARIRVLATPVCLPDVEARYGRSPFAVKTPFVPGYAAIGVVDAIGEGVTKAAVGERVAALTLMTLSSVLKHEKSRRFPTGCSSGQLRPGLSRTCLSDIQTLSEPRKPLAA